MTDSSVPGSASGDDDQNLGAEGTIPNTDDGVSVGHDPEASNFNPEEDVKDAEDGLGDSAGSEGA